MILVCTHLMPGWVFAELPHYAALCVCILDMVVSVAFTAAGKEVTQSIGTIEKGRKGAFGRIVCVCGAET